MITIHLCVKHPFNAMFRKKLCSNVMKGKCTPGSRNRGVVDMLEEVLEVFGDLYSNKKYCLERKRILVASLPSEICQ